MLLSAVSVLAVALPSSEIPEGLTNYIYFGLHIHEQENGRIQNLMMFT
jgi:hypothetical protein